tara:strand:- start:516 stop:1235 length:720 start_codon:yes stop_codon:yes gene_type:complete
MEITLFEALKKFFIKGKLIFLLILIFSFGVYPLIESNYFDYKDNDYLLIRIDTNTIESSYPEIKETPIEYLDRLQRITSRNKSDRNQDLRKLDCRGFVGPRKYEVDCYFFIKLNKSNRAEEVENYINLIKEDYKNYQLKTLLPFIKKEKEKVKVRYDEFKWQEEMGIDPNMMHFYDSIFNFRREIKLLENLYSHIKNNDTKSLMITHKILNIEKDTLYNSILIFIMLSFINFCRVILIN